MTRRAAWEAAMCVMFGASTAAGTAEAAPVPRSAWEQRLDRDPDGVARRWRFGRGQAPLAATLRVYADGLRLLQGPDYTLGHDAGGWYVDILQGSYSWIIADFEE